MVVSVQPKPPRILQSRLHFVVVEPVGLEDLGAQSRQLLCFLRLGLAGECADNEVLLALQ
jgi:hypothetical protein